jgi:hypothetical protein
MVMTYPQQGPRRQRNNNESGASRGRTWKREMERRVEEEKRMGEEE